MKEQPHKSIPIMRSPGRLNKYAKAAVATLLLVTLTGCIGWAPGQQAYWDEKVKDMCEKDGGTRVFEEIEIPKQQYDLLLNNFGKLSIPLEPNSDNAPLFRKEQFTYIRDANPSVWRYELLVIRKSDKKLLGKQVIYSRVGGDFPSPAHDSSVSCPEKQIDLFSAVVKLRREAR